MPELFLESYGGQTIQQLIAMKDRYRIDSLVLAVEQALGSKAAADLTEAERVVLAVEGLEREVNNGGYHQFFLNSSGEFTGFIVRALELIACPKVAAITAEAIASQQERDKLDACDSRYYENDENIAERLFAYIEQHQQEIRIP